MERPSWNEYFKEIVLATAKRSPCERLKVGCLLVRENRIIAQGYNGFLPDCPHDSIIRNNHEQATVHAEQNAISNIVVKSCEPLTAYVTHRPCRICAKLLWQNNVRRWLVEKGSDAESFSDEDRIVFDFLVENGLTFYTMKTDAGPFINVYNKLIGD